MGVRPIAKLRGVLSAAVAVGLAIASMSVSGSALPSAAATETDIGTHQGPVEAATLSSSEGERYTYSGDAAHLTARAPALVADRSIREVFWQPDVAPTEDEQVCTVWDDTASSAGSPKGNRQMGLALRIAPATSDGRGVRAITLTQNVFAGATWIFWVDAWNVVDPGHGQSTPVRQFAAVHQFDLFPIVGIGATATAPPWHVCAQVQGLTFRFKLWTGTEREPAWDDKSRVFATALPAGWDYAGHAGGYIGHLWSSQTASFSNLTTKRIKSTDATGSGQQPSWVDAAPPATAVPAQPTYTG